MKMIKPSDENVRPGRKLLAWVPELSTVKEFAWIVADKTEKDLGNHSHPYDEPFLLVEGKCELTTWNEKDGLKKHQLEAPCFFVIPAYEEHLFNANSDKIILVTYKDHAFAPTNFIPATHLKS